MIKLCTQCKWHNKITTNWCENPIVAGISHIDGKVNAKPCMRARNTIFKEPNGNSCGPEARYFEQKPKTLWQKLKEKFNA